MNLFLKFASISIISTLAFALEARSQESIRSEYRETVDIGFLGSGNGLENYLDILAGRNQHDHKHMKDWEGSAPVEARACSGLYDSLFDDGVLRMNLAFGYHDSGVFTLDAGLYGQAYNALTRSCSSTPSRVCGFRSTMGSATSHVAILEREIDWTKRSGETSRVKMVVTLAHGSDTTEDDYNIDGRAPTDQQKLITRLAEDVFFGGISGVKRDGTPAAKCEICGYYGHARNGGGPDFSPVPYAWRDSKGEPDYSYYLSRMTGYRKVLKGLQMRQSDPPKMVSLMSCYSQKHFWAKKVCAVKDEPGCQPISLSDFAGQTGFVLSRDYSWPENFSRTVGVLFDTILGFKCKSAWDSNMGRLKALPGNNEDYGLFGKFF